MRLLRTYLFIIILGMLLAPAVSRAGGEPAWDELYPLLEKYEAGMQQAAQDWLAQKYLAAIDGFNLSRKLLDDNLPPPSERFAWECFSTLKSYSLMLMRLVQADYFRAKGEEARRTQTLRQARQWAGNLQQDAETWKKAVCRDPRESRLRQKWLTRAERAAAQAEKTK